eukprot:213663_1
MSQYSTCSLFLFLGLAQSATPNPYCNAPHGVLIVPEGGNYVYCFRSDCSQYGGTGCAPDDCCMNNIRTGPTCDQNGPPTKSCLMAPLTPDPYCTTGHIAVYDFNGTGSDIYCFRAECSPFGGDGCSPYDCCYGGIKSGALYCDVSGPPSRSCLMRKTPDPECNNGTLIDDFYCFRADCPQYGGLNCTGDCCNQFIIDNDIYCDLTGPPTISCKMHTGNPTKTPTTNPTFNPTSTPTTSMPTLSPTASTSAPSVSTIVPTKYPSTSPSKTPSQSPIIGTYSPTITTLFPS